jgi:hypothetical protein
MLLLVICTLCTIGCANVFRISGGVIYYPLGIFFWYLFIFIFFISPDVGPGGLLNKNLDAPVHENSVAKL